MGEFSLIEPPNNRKLSPELIFECEDNKRVEELNDEELTVSLKVRYNMPASRSIDHSSKRG